jgi:hypothetical protein
LNAAVARELLVYWKLAAPRAAGAEAAAAAMQTELAQAHAGLQARLYRRSDTRGAVVTLMETYASRDAGGVGPALQAAIEAAAARHLNGWCDGLRHVETFDRLGG